MTIKQRNLLAHKIRTFLVDLPHWEIERIPYLYEISDDLKKYPGKMSDYFLYYSINNIKTAAGEAANEIYILINHPNYFNYEL